MENITLPLIIQTLNAKLNAEISVLHAQKLALLSLYLTGIRAPGQWSLADNDTKAVRVDQSEPTPTAPTEGDAQCEHSPS